MLNHVKPTIHQSIVVIIPSSAFDSSLVAGHAGPAGHGGHMPPDLAGSQSPLGFNGSQDEVAMDQYLLIPFLSSYFGVHYPPHLGILVLIFIFSMDQYL